MAVSTFSAVMDINFCVTCAANASQVMVYFICIF